MDAIECIEGRKSIRAFKSEPIDRALLTRLIDVATHSPSYKNSQPWEVLIISGDKKRALTERLLQLFHSGVEPSPDLVAPVHWPAAEAGRIEQMLSSRSKILGVDITLPAIVKRSKEANFNFYGAPHVIYLYQDASLSDWSLFDLGLFAQSLMLAAHAKGLATVPQAFATDYAKEVKAFLSIPEGKRLVLGISIGYPDMDAPINQFQSERAETDEIVTWVE
ncbi:MAG: nitroreductase [Candidatus Polarisedimenticolaceae bacterium]|nr:nitroreductase [Candidatus Polarisedimenticolaceae bacterium]